MCIRDRLLSDGGVEISRDIQLESVSLPDKSISPVEQVFYTDVKETFTKLGLDFNPVVKIIGAKLQPPSIDNPIGDIDRLVAYIEHNEKINVIFDIKTLYSLPDSLRNNLWKVKTVLFEKIASGKFIYELSDVLSPQHDKFYAIVVDVGTTTVVSALVDILHPKIICVKAMLNKQSVYGQDVITRILYSEKDNGLFELHKQIVFTINDLISTLAKTAKVRLKDIYTVVVAGNTTMMHFLFKLISKYIRREPYVPVVNKLPVVDVDNVGIMINPEGKIYALPTVSSYIGGDIVGGVVVCGIDISDDVCVLLDLGTNGEIVVGNKDFLVSAACSCGPAFEGVGIESGMLAIRGAIEDIKINNGNVEMKVIEDEKPIGICGSGLIGLPAELFKSGVIDRAGRFVKDIKNSMLKKRIRENQHGEYEFIVVNKDFTANNKDIVITESDLQNILRAKGAIFHGLHTLLKYLNLKFGDIKKIYISGGFGRYIDIKKAQVLGLLPDIEEEKFVISGNTSLLGGVLFLLSGKARERIYKVQQKMAYIDLSSLPVYMNDYSSSLFIPHTDLSLFPNVVKYLSSG
ncbi:MAG: ASKHA domain-containing protein, partial [Endomicrobia bacterium]|nr:ASKHA domain-containing protein [Endomicrobiia bacterium]